MNRIDFVRHSEGQDSVVRKYSSPWNDHSLGERGQLQALQTGKYLAGLPTDGIFCSPMKRAHETTQIIARQFHMGFTVMPEFQEANLGNLEGMDFTDQNWSIHHNVTNRWYAGDSRASFPGGDAPTTTPAIPSFSSVRKK